ncbi:hypothetical protein ABDD95_21480 [Mucilaginibacter sp. PAMB04274]|uniref:hypothetical protein n=1 Tax=Mucilaginibacter sp. PAMB04274 TaxID=3138568 RepID=UPI0031F65E4C
MRRELIEFSDRIDEQFEPAVTETGELWINMLNWFSTTPNKSKRPEPPYQTYITKEGRLVSTDGVF